MKKLILLLAMCTGGYAMAQNATMSGTTDDETARFIKKAVMTDMKEIKAGKMAQEKAFNPQVRSFGEMMVREHTNSSAELRTIASRKNIMLPMDNSAMSNAGASSGTYMGTTGQSSYTGGTISARSLRGTAGMKLSKAQTTPSRKYYNGVPTNWTDKDVNPNARVTTSTWSDDSGASSNTSMGISGQDMTTGTVNANTTTTVRTNSEEPGVSSSGNLGVSGTTGTLTANAEFNGATMGTDSVARGTSTTTQSMATGTSSDMSLTDMEDDHRNKLNKLSQKSGAEFDREYMDMMVNGHSKAIELYEDASKSNDTDVSAFATKMLPVLRQHHEQAKTIKRTVDPGL